MTQMRRTYALTALITLAAPVMWGTTYVLTQHVLPADRPLWVAITRALPAGVLLQLVSRARPRGHWWWRSLVVGTLIIGAFFALLFFAAYRLPSGLGATMNATQPFLMMLIALVVLHERPTHWNVIGSATAAGGVALLTAWSPQHIDALGAAAMLLAVASATLGFALVRRWTRTDPVDLVALTAWQLLAGGLVLLPFAIALEPLPPQPTAATVLAFAYLSIAATAAAYLCWFYGLRRLSAVTVTILGLVNPAVGTLLGVLVNHEAFGALQAIGLLCVVVGVIIGQRRAAPTSTATATDASSAQKVGEVDVVPAACCRP